MGGHQVYTTIHWQTHSTECEDCVCATVLISLLGHTSSKKLSPSPWGWMLLRKELIRAEDSPHISMQHMTELKRRLSVVVGVSVVTQPKPRSTVLYLTAGLHAEVNEHNHPTSFESHIQSALGFTLKWMNTIIQPALCHSPVHWLKAGIHVKVNEHSHPTSFESHIQSALSQELGLMLKWMNTIIQSTLIYSPVL